MTPSGLQASLRVQKLNIKAVRLEDVYRSTHLIEDAVRTISLPFVQRGRLFFIRRLNIGKISRAASAQTVSLLVERALKRKVSDARVFSHPDSSDAPAVYFPGWMEAYTHLARLHAQQATTSAWYWSRIVPEWEARPDRVARWQSLFEAVHLHPEAVRISAALIRQAIDADCIKELVEALSEPQIKRYLDHYGWHSNHSTVGDTSALIAQKDHALLSEVMSELADIKDRGPHMLWILSLVLVKERPQYGNAASLPAHVYRWLDEIQWPQRSIKPSPSPRPDPDEKQTTLNSITTEPQALKQQTETTESEIVEDVFQRETPHHFGKPLFQDEPFTHFAGLFFLIPVLEHLGFNAWLNRYPEMMKYGLPLRILKHIADRLGLSLDDPLSRFFLEHQYPDESPLMGDWTDLFEEMLINIDAWPKALEEVWALKLEAWLQHYTDLKLEEVVCRKGRMYWSKTHIDLNFPLSQLDVGVRRYALDVNPGWVSWLGYVISYHYVESNG